MPATDWPILITLHNCLYIWNINTVYFKLSAPKSLPLLCLWMLFLSILKDISSMVLCGIIQASGPICFSHLPFLQGQSMPAVMVARAHSPLCLVLPSAFFFFLEVFSFPQETKQLLVSSSSSAGSVEAEMLSLLWHNKNAPGGHAARRAQQKGEVHGKTELRLKWIWWSGNHLGERYRMSWWNHLCHV